MKENYYSSFDNFILRTPIFPFSYIYQEDYDSPLFKESLFIASPDLYKEKSRKVEDFSKIAASLYKYYSRAASRSTPFGLFAACSIGTTNTENNKCLVSKPENVKRHTRLDMNFLCSLLQHLESLPYIQMHLRYYPNDSLYSIGNKIRYVEYYFKGLKKIHQIQEVLTTDYIEIILNAAKSGCNINTLAQTIVNNDISINDAIDFIKELICNQLLKSELEANLTGDDVLSHTIQVLQKLDAEIPELECLIRISNILNEIDNNLYHNETLYANLYNYANSFNINYDTKYFIQTDTFRDSSAYLSKKTINELSELISFLTRLNHYNNKEIENFAHAFRKRYEEQEIPLLEALDIDIGIGYPISMQSDCINPLLDNIINHKYIQESTLKLTSVEALIMKKFQEAALKESKIIESLCLEDSDILTKKIDTNKLVSTCNVMFQIIKDTNNEDNYYIIKSVGGATAASLLGRFCHLDDNILTLETNICKKEQELLDEGIVAEIVHLPDTRIGNIAFRPILRSAEIHYLAHSGANIDMSIPASDLVLGIKRGRLYIKSKTLNKEIIPRLSNAHNYNKDGLPVYKFLCDMQTYGLISPASINVNNLLSIFDYLPRVYYKKSILVLRTWIISEACVLKNGNLDFSYFKMRHIPEKFIIKEFDNELFIDTTLLSSIEVFKDILKKKKKIIIQEFLYTDNSSIITDGELHYCGEFIVPFYKN